MHGTSRLALQRRVELTEHDIWTITVENNSAVFHHVILMLRPVERDGPHKT
jgi:hypothetical protein